MFTTTYLSNEVCNAKLQSQEPPRNILVCIGDAPRKQKIHPVSFILSCSKEHTMLLFTWIQCTDLFSQSLSFSYCTLKYCSTKLPREGLGRNPEKCLFWKVYLPIWSLGILFRKTTDWHRHVMLGPWPHLHAITTWGQPFSHSHVWIKCLLVVGVHAVHGRTFINIPVHTSIVPT